MRVTNYTLYNLASTGAGVTNSSSIDMDQSYGIAVQASWSGNSGTATLTLQASNDGVVWTDLASTVNVTGASGSGFLYATDFHYTMARVEIDVASDVSNLKLQVNAKGF